MAGSIIPRPGNYGLQQGQGGRELQRNDPLKRSEEEGAPSAVVIPKNGDGRANKAPTTEKAAMPLGLTLLRKEGHCRRSITIGFVALSLKYENINMRDRVLF